MLLITQQYMCIFVFVKIESFIFRKHSFLQIIDVKTILLNIIMIIYFQTVTVFHCKMYISFFPEAACLITCP